MMSSEPLVHDEMEAVRRRERRAAAVARTAAKVAGERSLPATLRVLAQEILQEDGLAAVQVFTNEHPGDKLHMLGIAGFPASSRSDFYARLMDCQSRGADLRMFDAFRLKKPVIIPHRYEAVMTDPAWKPLHEYHRRPEWDAFASIPITVRQSVIGILNVFVAPGKEIDREALNFLLSMAEQAGLAIDYAFLLEQERNAAHREERQRLARDLHDSVVQKVFSMGMLAQTLTILTERDRAGALPRIRELTTDLESITSSVLSDLRGLVAQLRPSAVGAVGLREALANLEATTHRQTGVTFHSDIGEVADEVFEDFAEDLYQVVAEAVHNAVKHSSAERITVSIDLDDLGRIQLHVRDDGGGLINSAKGSPAQLREGDGLSFMRQRVERWGGQLTVDFEFGGVGTLVHAELPLQGHRPSPGLEKSKTHND